MTPRHPLIVCDYGEERSGVPDELRKRGAIVEMAQLGCGDYLVSAAFALERKAPRDLVDSLLNRKLYAQLDRLVQSFEYAALVIEGDTWAGDRKLRSPLLGELYHWLSFRPGVTVLYSPSTQWTARLLFDLARREQFERLGGAPTGETVPRRTARRPRDILLAFPGVGDANADKLLTRFGSVQAVVQASSDDLVGAIGAKRGRHLHDLLTREA
jgi:Fanconi anemia group M protein